MHTQFVQTLTCTSYIRAHICDRLLVLMALSIGLDFAERIRKEKEGEAKFNFLNPGNPYHAYFLHKIEEIKSGVSSMTLLLCIRVV